VVIFATLPLVLKNWDQVGKYNFEYEFLPIGVVPKVKSEYEATKSAWLERLTAENILISDLESGAVLLDKNSTTSAFPASTTKMLTAMVAKEVYDLDVPLTVTKDALAEGNLLKYRVGEKLVAGDLIKALLINSSNESAEVLAKIMN
jgi:D-alanyl-D-alanine carboxypeptidase